MNKGRRHELKMLKYKRRLALRGRLSAETLANPKGERYNFTSFRNHSAPCSCWACSPPDKKYNRAKEKVSANRILIQNDPLQAYYSDTTIY